MKPSAARATSRIGMLKRAHLKRRGIAAAGKCTALGRVVLSLCLTAAIVCPALASGQAQTRADDVQTAFARAQHLRRGINLSHWFSQSVSNYTAQHTNTWMNDSDISLIARLGFDHVRLSIDAAPLEQAPLGKEGLNDDFVGRLDHAVDTILADGLAVQVDLHPEESYKMPLRSSAAAVDQFVMLWRKLASHFASRDPNRVFFEVMNEPEQYDPYRWAGIQMRAAAAIRQAAPQNTIIATGPNYSDIVDLLTLQPLADGNVIYNFHFYDPHEFTHQGAGWGVPWWSYTHGIPYPPAAGEMKELLEEVPDAADRFALEEYWLDHWNAHRIRLLIDEAADWGRAHHVPLICNEFGVYRRSAAPQSRDAWLHDVRKALESAEIGWTMWDYRGDFGVVTVSGQGVREPDPGTMKALGLKMPATDSVQGSN